MDTSKIKNLIVRKALQNRARDFVFNFGGRKGHSESTHEDWDDYGDYEERYTHTDDTAGSRHSKHTDHTETTYSEYDDYIVTHEDEPYRDD